MINTNIIKKLFNKGLSTDERAALNESKFMDDLLLEQWDESFNEHENLDQAYRIWDKIQHKKRKEHSSARSNFRNYSIAASIAQIGRAHV